MEKFNRPENDPYQSVDHSDLTDAEVAKIMGEKLANAFLDEVRSAEKHNALDEVAETDRSPEPPTIEETLRDFDASKIDAELADMLGDNDK